MNVYSAFAKARSTYNLPTFRAVLKGRPSLVHERNEDNQTLLQYLVFQDSYGRNDHAKVGELIRRGARIDDLDRMGMTALHSAAFEGHDDAARLLLRSGADPTIVSRFGTPEYIATHRFYSHIGQRPHHHDDDIRRLLGDVKFNKHLRTVNVFLNMRGKQLEILNKSDDPVIKVIDL